MHTHDSHALTPHVHPHLPAQAVLTRWSPIESGAVEQVLVGLLHTALGQKPTGRLRHPPGAGALQSVSTLSHTPYPSFPNTPHAGSLQALAHTVRSTWNVFSFPNPPDLVNFYSSFKTKFKSYLCPHSLS